MYQLYTLFKRKDQGTPYHVGAREVKKNNKQTNKQTKILVAIGVFILPFP